MLHYSFGRLQNPLGPSLAPVTRSTAVPPPAGAKLAGRQTEQMYRLLAIAILSAALFGCDQAVQPSAVEDERAAWDPLPEMPDERLSDHLMWHRWKQEVITWAVTGSSDSVRVNSVRSAAAAALDVWAQATTLSFLESEAGESDLRIQVSGDAACVPDDCPFGIGFLPGHATRAGEIVLPAETDLEDQDWVRELLLHHAGHALGIQHLDDTGSVMSATVRTSAQWHRLGHLDRESIRGLYGRPDAVPPEDPPLRTLPTIQSCFSAVRAPQDLDGDGLSDANERYGTGSDPLKCDTDHDELSDLEVLWGLDPLSIDSDEDENVDSQEAQPGRHPLLADHRIWWFGGGNFRGTDSEGRLVQISILPENGAVGTVRLSWNGQFAEFRLIGGYISADRRFFLRTLDRRIRYDGAEVNHRLVFGENVGEWVATRN